MRHTYIAVLFLLLLYSFSDASDTTTASGPRVAFIENGNSYQATAEGIFRAPLEKVWALLSDHERAPVYLKEITMSRVVSRRGAVSIIAQRARVALTDIDLLIEMTEDRARHTMRWRQMKGPFASNTGSWRLFPEGSSRTRGIYELRIVNDTLIPGFIVKNLVRSNIPEMFHAIAKQVEN